MLRLQAANERVIPSDVKWTGPEESAFSAPAPADSSSPGGTKLLGMTAREDGGTKLLGMTAREDGGTKLEETVPVCFVPAGSAVPVSDC